MDHQMKTLEPILAAYKNIRFEAMVSSHREPSQSRFSSDVKNRTVKVVFHFQWRHLSVSVGHFHLLLFLLCCHCECLQTVSPFCYSDVCSSRSISRCQLRGPPPHTADLPSGHCAQRVTQTHTHIHCDTEHLDVAWATWALLLSLIRQIKDQSCAHANLCHTLLTFLSRWQVLYYSFQELVFISPTLYH